MKVSVETNPIGWPIFSVLFLLGLNFSFSGPSFLGEGFGSRSSCGDGAVLKVVHKFVNALKFLYSNINFSVNEIFNNSI